MQQDCDRVAGLDVHRDIVVACVRVGRGDKVKLHRGKFATTAKGVKELISFMADLGVERVAMESTGVYWKPVYYPMEGCFQELWLCNAHHVQNVPGRKTDVNDAEWLADVAAHGMVRPSLVPPPEVRALRELTRYRKTQVTMRGQEIQRLEKVLQDAGVKITSFASNVLGVSTRSMLEAMLAGETDVKVLADKAKGRMRSKIVGLEEALAPQLASHHKVAVRAILDHVDYLDASIARLDQAVLERMGPFEPAVAALVTIPGVGRMAAEMVVAESGADMSRFPTAGHFAAWAGVAPANYESAGKRQSRGARFGSPWLKRTLVESAKSASRTKGSYLGAQYKQIARRRGPNKATIAVAHTLTVAIWHMLSDGTEWADLGPDFFQRDLGEHQQTTRLIAKLKALGYEVTITPPAA
jgi:transposase